MPPRTIHDPAKRLEHKRAYMRDYNKRYRAEHLKEERAWRQARKRDAIVYKGGQCQRCGYSKCIAALAFHHRNPAEKEYQIATMFQWSWERILKELDKCDLLCMNCHAELHFEEGDYANTDRYRQHFSGNHHRSQAPS